MSTVTKDQLFAAAPEIATVNIPRLGGDIKIKALTRGARKAWMEAITNNDPDAMEVLVVQSLVEPALSLADVKKLNEVDEKVLDEVFAAISEFNGWSARPGDDSRREILKKVADGDLEVEEALASFRS